MSGFQQRIRQLEVELGQSAGSAPLDDRFKVGAVAAYLDLIYVDFEGDSDE